MALKLAELSVGTSLSLTGAVVPLMAAMWGVTASRSLSSTSSGSLSRLLGSLAGGSIGSDQSVQTRARIAAVMPSSRDALMSGRPVSGLTS
jgi:hypothetical protein